MSRLRCVALALALAMAVPATSPWAVPGPGPWPTSTGTCLVTCGGHTCEDYVRDGRRCLDIEASSACSCSGCDCNYLDGLRVPNRDNCPRRCPLGQYWQPFDGTAGPPEGVCKYDDPTDFYCGCDQYLSASPSTCDWCSRLDGNENAWLGDAHHKGTLSHPGCSGMNDTAAAIWALPPPAPLPGALILENSHFRLTFMSDLTGSDRLEVKRTGRNIAFGPAGRGAYCLKFSFYRYASPGSAATRHLTSNITLSSDNGTLIVTAMDGAQEVVLGVEIRSDYIKLEVVSFRGFAASFWDIAQAEFDLELRVDTGAEAVGARYIPAWTGPEGAVGVLPLDYMVDAWGGHGGYLGARWSSLRHPRSDPLQGSAAAPYGAIALVVTAPEDFAAALLQLQLDAPTDLPLPAGGYTRSNVVAKAQGPRIRPSGFGQGGFASGQQATVRHAVEKTKSQRVKLDGALWSQVGGALLFSSLAEEVRSLGANLEYVLPFNPGCLDVNAEALLPTSASGSDFLSWGNGTLHRAVLVQDTTILISPGTVAGRISGNVNSQSTSAFLWAYSNPALGRRASRFNQMNQLQIGDEIVEISALNATSDLWTLTVSRRGLHSTVIQKHAQGAVARFIVLSSRPKDESVRAPILDPEGAMQAAIVQSWVERFQQTQSTIIDMGGQACDGIMGDWVQRKFMMAFVKQLGTPVLFASSVALSPYYYYMQATSTAAGAFTDHLPKAYFVQSFISRTRPFHDDPWDHHVDLGSFRIRTDSPTGLFHAVSLDELEWFMSKVSAYKASWELDLPVHPQDASETHGQIDQLLELIGLWVTASRNGWFPLWFRRDTLAQADYKCDWSNGREVSTYPACATDNEFFGKSFRITGKSVSGAIVGVSLRPVDITYTYMSSDTVAAQVRNRFATQPLRFELRILPAFDLAAATTSEEHGFQLLPADHAGFQGSFDPDKLAIAGSPDNHTFTLTASADLRGTSAEATWSIQAALLDMSPGQTGRSGVHMTVTGDGQGGYLYLGMRSLGGGRKFYPVKNDFSGTRPVFIPSHEFNDDIFSNELWHMYGLDTGPTQRGFEPDKVNHVSIGLVNAPLGSTMVIKRAMALPNIMSPLSNPTISVGDSLLDPSASRATIAGCIPPRHYVVYEGGSTAQLLDAQRTLTATLAVTNDETFAAGLTQPSGDFSVTVQAGSPGTCSGPGGYQPYLRVLWKALGPESEFPGASSTTTPTVTTITEGTNATGAGQSTAAKKEEQEEDLAPPDAAVLYVGAGAGAGAGACAVAFCLTYALRYRLCTWKERTSEGRGVAKEELARDSAWPCGLRTFKWRAPWAESEVQSRSPRATWACGVALSKDNEPGVVEMSGSTLRVDPNPGDGLAVKNQEEMERANQDLARKIRLMDIELRELREARRSAGSRLDQVTEERDMLGLRVASIQATDVFLAAVRNGQAVGPSPRRIKRRGWRLRLGPLAETRSLPASALDTRPSLVDLEAQGLPPGAAASEVADAEPALRQRDDETPESIRVCNSSALSPRPLAALRVTASRWARRTPRLGDCCSVGRQAAAVVGAMAVQAVEEAVRPCEGDGMGGPAVPPLPLPLAPS